MSSTDFFIHDRMLSVKSGLPLNTNYKHYQWILCPSGKFCFVNKGRFGHHSTFFFIIYHMIMP